MFIVPNLNISKLRMCTCCISGSSRTSGLASWHAHTHTHTHYSPSTQSPTSLKPISPFIYIYVCSKYKYIIKKNINKWININIYIYILYIYIHIHNFPGSPVNTIPYIYIYPISLAKVTWYSWTRARGAQVWVPLWFCIVVAPAHGRYPLWGYEWLFPNGMAWVPQTFHSWCTQLDACHVSRYCAISLASFVCPVFIGLIHL